MIRAKEKVSDWPHASIQPVRLYSLWSTWKGSIKYILINPGPIATRIRENSIPHFEKWIDWESSRKREFYETTFRPRLYRRDNTKDAFEKPPAAVTKKLIHALEARRPRKQYFVTAPTYAASLITKFLPTAWQDALLR